MVETLVLLGYVPPLLWLAFFARRDRRREPPGLLAALFAIGVLPVVLVALFVNELGGAVLAVLAGRDTADLGVALVVAPVGEEILKVAGVFLVAWRHRAFDEPVDGIVYATAVAFGFAATENTLYFLEVGTTETGEVFAVVVFLRSFGSAVLHGLATGLAGYQLGLARSGRRRLAPALALGLLQAIAAHATWNLLAVSGPAILASPLLLIGLGVVLVRRFGRALQESPARRAQLPAWPLPPPTGPRR